MTRQDEMFMPHDAVLREVSGETDAYGEPTFKDAVNLRVYWRQESRQARDANGNTISVSTVVTVNQSIPIGSIMWKGHTDNLPTPTPWMEVVEYSETPDVKGRNPYREVLLGVRSEAAVTDES